ncbi:hypothetical protein ES703_61701 [subsurface metagenome]
MEIIGMTKEQLINLDPQSVDRLLSTAEIVYIAKTLEAFWQFDYEAAEQGRPGYHAELKSLLHSDGFFVSAILLQYPNVRAIMVNQMVAHFNRLKVPKPGLVAGIPRGATQLGKDVADILGAENVEMKKEDDRIILVNSIDDSSKPLLLVEDFCTRGTGFTEAVLNIRSKQPEVNFLPYGLYILNRGGLKEISVEGVGSFRVVAVAEHRINDWEPSKCPLCPKGSKVIKPKATDENWRLITTAQLGKAN